MVGVGIAHVRALDESFDKKEVVLYPTRESVGFLTTSERRAHRPFTALRRRAEASFSAMAGGGGGRLRGRGRRGWMGVTVIGELKLLSALADSAQPKQAIIRRNDHVQGLVLGGVGVRKEGDRAAAKRAL